MNKLFFLSLLAVAVLAGSSCKHYLLTPVDPNPVDTTPGLGQPCSPDTVYFQTQILPILLSNCSMSGCHDAITQSEGVILTSYTNVMQTADVDPFNPNGSDLYKVLIDNDPDKLMPRPPAAPLTAAQIALIRLWINQGALDLACDENAGGCDTTNMSFANDIFPILQTKCVGCHSGGNPGGGINLSNFAGISAVAANGRLLGSIQRQVGYSAMPKGGTPMPPCEVSKIAAWVQAGAPNN